MPGDGTTDVQLEQRLKGVPGFLGVYANDELPNPKEIPRDSCFIANYSAREEAGTHWVAFLHINAGSRPPEFFDSYGFPPGGENSLLNTRAPFQRFMESAAKGGKFYYNHVNLQCADSDVCGEYCAQAILTQELPEDPKTGKIRPEWRRLINLTGQTCKTADERVKKQVGVRRMHGRRG